MYMKKVRKVAMAFGLLVSMTISQTMIYAAEVPSVAKEAAPTKDANAKEQSVQRDGAESAPTDKDKDKAEGEEAGGGAPAAPLVYNCHVGACCSCSSVYSDAVKEIIERDRFNPSVAGYSQGNFLDDIRMGIYNAIRDGGSDYEFELAKFEMMTLLDHYLVSSRVPGKKIQMYVRESGSWVRKDDISWSKRAAVEAFINEYLYNQETTSEANARAACVNIWNNYIVSMIDVGKPNLTLSDVQDVLKTLGLGNLEGKSLEEMKECLGHTHVPTAYQVPGYGYAYGICEDCKCNHICSVLQKEAVARNVIKGNAVPGYQYYVVATITTTNPELEGLMADTINVGVINLGTESEPDYVVGECVCRLGAELVDNHFDSEWNTDIEIGDNTIQPQGLMNVTTTFKPDKKIKEVSVELDMTNLVEDQLDGKEVISYNLAKSSIELYKVDGASETLVGKDKYTVTNSGNIVKLAFDNPEDYINAGEKYKVKCYVSSKLGTGIQYAKKDSETDADSMSYLSKKLNTTCKVTATLKGRVKIKDQYSVGPTGSIICTEIFGATIQEASYSDIEVQYVYIAKVY